MQVRDTGKADDDTTNEVIKALGSILTTSVRLNVFVQDRILLDSMFIAASCSSVRVPSTHTFPARLVRHIETAGHAAGSSLPSI
jgi:hypothetical protein